MSIDVTRYYVNFVAPALPQPTPMYVYTSTTWIKLYEMRTYRMLLRPTVGSLANG